jgi:hypothetical protein
MHSTHVLLCAMGCNQNILLEVVHEPAYLDGVGLYIEQGYLKISALLEHIRRNGRLFQMV